MVSKVNAPDCTIKQGSIKDCFPFFEMRKEQEDILDALDKIYEQGKYRYIVIEAGTGIGKSAIAKTISKKDGSSYLLTSTKQLQDQYISDFYNDGARTVKGAMNYHCAKDDRMNCRLGLCCFDTELIKQCVAENICPYILARSEAEKSEMYVTSFSYFLQASSFSSVPNNFSRLLPRGAVIIDECHLIEDNLLQMAGLTLNKEQLIKKYNITDGIAFKDQIVFRKQFDCNDMNSVINWVSFVHKLISHKLIELNNSVMTKINGNYHNMTADELTDISDKDSTNMMNHIEVLQTMLMKMSNFLKSKDKSDWVIECNGDYVKILPLDVSQLYSKLIDKYAVNHVVMMSATIFDKKTFCDDLGIDIKQTAFITRDGLFDADKSPIVYNPIGSMNYANINKTLPFVVSEIRKILRMHKDEKGIIHTGNYTVAKYIIDNINDSRFIYREHNESNEMLFEYHANSDEPTVIVSPSLMTGVDLKDDYGRFQVIVKLPYISMTDARVKKKMEKNKKWYTSKMLCNLVQECGRATRHEQDWAVTYILDASFSNVIRYNKNLLPKSFLDRIKSNDTFNVLDYRKKMQDEQNI